jgi:hypothetical protein
MVYKFTDDGKLLANSKLPLIKKKNQDENVEELVLNSLKVVKTNDK